MTQGCGEKWECCGIRVGMYVCRALGVEEIVLLICPDWLDARGEATP